METIVYKILKGCETMTKRKRIREIVKKLDVVCVGLRELASFKGDKFDGTLWLGIYSEICEIAEELERIFHICKIEK